MGAYESGFNTASVPVVRGYRAGTVRHVLNIAGTLGPRRNLDHLLTRWLKGQHAMSPSERRRRIVGAVSIAKVIGEVLPLRQSGHSLKALCPFHNDHSNSLEVDTVGRRFQCWECDISGDVVDFVCKYESLTISEALDVLEAGPES